MYPRKWHPMSVRVRALWGRSSRYVPWYQIIRRMAKDLSLYLRDSKALA